jgi:sugar phosphate isomerase/epimerase
MNLMVCLRGEPEQDAFLHEIAGLGAGIELGSYGMVGIRSERDWQSRFARHRAVRSQFQGAIAVHGPFIGMEYAHVDHMIRDVVSRRMDMIFDVAVKLKACRVVLHGGYKAEIDLFKLQEDWLRRSVEFWKQEMHRWSDAGISIVLENDIDRTPDPLVRLVDAVGSPGLGLCMDIGHQHLFSELGAVEWVRRMDQRLFHVHLHDNDGTADHHWPIGRGTIDFESFCDALVRSVPQATVSLEVEDKTEAKMDDLRLLAACFPPKRNGPR